MSSGQLIGNALPVIIAVVVGSVAVVPMRHAVTRSAIPRHAVRPSWVPITVAALSVAAITIISPRAGLLEVVAAVLVPLLTWLAWVDVRSKRIPTSAVYAVAAIAVVGCVCQLPVLGWSGVADVLLVAVAATAILLGCALLTAGRAIGAADVRLAFPLGVLVGPLGWSGLAATMILAVLVMFPAAIISVIARRRGGSGAAAMLPFAPGLVAGAVLALLLAP